MPRVSVIILNWNGVGLTKNCLAALSQQSYKDINIVVVDNGSTDGSLEYLRSQDNITTLAQKKNLGYAKANNIAIRYTMNTTNPDYIVLLNNDTLPEKNWLETLLTYMEEHSGIGLAQGANFSDSQKTIYDSTGIYIEEGFIPRQRASGKQSEDLSIPSIGPNAAGIIIRKELIQDISYKDNFFDNSFFAYAEDVDMILRAFWKGWQHAYIPKAKLKHIGSVTGNKVSTKKMYWGTRNLIRILIKDVPMPLLKKKFKKIVISHLANIQFLCKTNKRLMLSYIKGLLIGLCSLPFYLAKRRYIMRGRIKTDQELVEKLVPSNPPLYNPLKRRRA